MRQMKVFNFILPIVLILQFLIYIFDKDSRWWYVPLVFISYSIGILILWFTEDLAKFLNKKDVKESKGDNK